MSVQAAHASSAALSAAPDRAVRTGTGYRPDIDGLRAVAVIGVVAYHAFPSLLKGGFVGVDIFFVISGFLITRHILGDLAAGKFSIGNFYARRIRRIFPALVLVLAACLLFGWLVLTPGEYENLGRQTFAGAVFLSNFQSWREAGYFDAAADTKPMLHLWSLGIEEQFYIAWPLLLALAWRFGWRMRWLLWGIVGVSLIYSLVMVRRDLVADFYSPLTRCWELAIGAVVAWRPRDAWVWTPRQRDAAAALGAGLITLAMVLVDAGDRFPGAWALLPCIGAALLIDAGEGAWVNRRWLALRPLVWVGLISFPLYLWHWPLLTYARIIEAGTPPADVRLALVAASVLLAWLTYRTVEQPVRARTRSRWLVALLSAALLAVGLAGFWVKSAHGVKERVSGMLNGDPATMVLGADRGALLPGCGIADAKKNHDLTYCLRNRPEPPRYAMLGDSKAEALFYGLVRESAGTMTWTLIGTVYPPDPQADPAARLERKHRVAYRTVLESPSVEVVVMAMALRAVVPTDAATGLIAAGATVAPARIAAYDEAIRAFHQAGKRVVFVIDNPTLADPTSCVSGGVTSSEWLNRFLYRKENARCRLRYSEHRAGTQAYLDFVAGLLHRHPDLRVYDPAPLLCDIARDQCPMTRDGKFLYSYSDHLSDVANSLLAQDLLPTLRQLAR